MRRLALIPTLLFAVLARPPRSEGQATARQRVIVARDSTAEMERLADGIFAILHQDATDEWPHGNAGIIVGRTGVLIIDSNYLPDRAAADIALVRQVTNVPIRYLVNTHWHGDHTHGNAVYADAFPGLAILGPRESAGFIALNQEKLPRGATAPGSFSRRALSQLETTLAAGHDSAGKALTDQERRELRETIGQRRHELVELAKVRVAPPTVIFDGSISLDLGDRRIEVRNMGRANSPADVIVYAPTEQVLFTGDILVWPAPYTEGAWMVPWIGVLEQLERYPVRALVPGHGQVQANHDYTRLVHDTFDSARRQLDSAYRRGLNLFDAQKAVDLGAFRLRFLKANGQAVSEGYWRDFAANVVAIMAECVHGYRC